MPDLSGGYWGTAVADHDRERLILTMKYYVFGQFTRYIRPGSRLIRISDQAVAAEDPQTHTISLVVINTGDAERPVRVDLSRFGDAVAPGTPVRVIRTSGSMESGEHWASLPDLAADEGGFSAVLAPWSVTTYLISERDV